MADTPDVLEINKDLLPYTCNILLAGELFMLKFNHNATADLFTVDLYKDGELICAGEPIIYGVPLWQDVYKSDTFPALTIIPKDPSGEMNAVTFDNLGETVLLIVENSGDGVEDEAQSAAGFAGSTSGSGTGGGTDDPETPDDPDGGDDGNDGDEYLTAEELEEMLT